MPEITDRIKTALAAFAKFSDEDVKKQTILALAQLDKHLDDLEYDPSSGVEKASELLNAAIMNTKEMYQTHETEKTKPEVVEADGAFELADEDVE